MCTKNKNYYLQLFEKEILSKNLRNMHVTYMRAMKNTDVRNPKS